VAVAPRWNGNSWCSVVLVILRPGSGLRALDCGLCLGGCAGADEPMSGEPLELHDERRHVPRLPRCLGMACRCAYGQCLKYRRLLQDDVMVLLQECCARLASPPVLQAPSQRHARLLPKSSFRLSQDKTADPRYVLGRAGNERWPPFRTPAPIPQSLWRRITIR
jgi:hypothetical protein